MTDDSLPHAPGSDSSKGAGDSMRPNAAGLRRRIYFHLLDDGPQTTEQLEQSLGLAGNTVRPRVLALVESGLACRRGTRRNQSGRHADIIHGIEMPADLADTLLAMPEPRGPHLRDERELITAVRNMDASACKDLFSQSGFKLAQDAFVVIIKRYFNDGPAEGREI